MELDLLKVRDSHIGVLIKLFINGVTEGVCALTA